MAEVERTPAAGDHREQRVLLDVGSGRHAPVPALLRRAASCATRRSPVCPYCHSTEWAPAEVSGRGVDRRVHGQRAHVDAELPAALRDRDRRHRGRRPRPAHHQHRELRARRRARRACRCRWCSSTTTTCGSPCSSRAGDPEKGPFPADDPKMHRRPPHADGAPRSSRTRWRSPASACRGSVGGSWSTRSCSPSKPPTRRSPTPGSNPSDIDGLSTYPGGAIGGGMSEGGITALEEVLRLRPSWINGGMELPGQAGSVIAAMLAVAGGLCNHVLCFRTVWEATYARPAARGDEWCARQRERDRRPRARNRVGGDMQWRLPYGASSAANWIGMLASAHFDRYGTTRETLGWIALNAREERGADAVGDLQGPAHDGRLHERADDHHAVRAVRLRRARATVRSRSSCRARTSPPT